MFFCGGVAFAIYDLIYVLVQHGSTTQEFARLYFVRLCNYAIQHPNVLPYQLPTLFHLKKLRHQTPTERAI
jgi:hypothetical protein